MQRAACAQCKERHLQRRQQLFRLQAHKSDTRRNLGMLRAPVVGPGTHRRGRGGLRGEGGESCDRSGTGVAATRRAGACAEGPATSGQAKKLETLGRTVHKPAHVGTGLS